MLSRRVVLTAVGVVVLIGVLAYALLQLEPNAGAAVATAVTLVATIVMAAATAALAWFGSVQISEGRRQQTERRAAVDARISAQAYALRRQLRSWYQEHHPHEKQSFLGWAATIQRHFDRAEDRLQELVAQIPEASPSVSRAVRQAYVEFYDATEIINREVAVGGTEGAALQLSTAFDGIRKCAHTISDAIDGDLRPL